MHDRHIEQNSEANEMTTYKMSFDKASGVLTVGFGEAASNDQIVKDAGAIAETLKPEISGTPCLKINGPASLPVAMVICHAFVHVVSSIACFDPKLSKYVVAVSHNPDFKVGDLVN